MKIAIEGEPIEIAALVLELQERQGRSSGQSLEEAMHNLGTSGSDGIQLCADDVLKNK